MHNHFRAIRARRRLIGSAGVMALALAAVAPVVVAASTASAASCTPAAVGKPNPSFALLMPLNSCATVSTTRLAPHARVAPRATHADGPAGSYTHVPAVNSGQDLSPGSGPIMPTTTIYYVWWLPTGLHFESDTAGDTNYENLLIRFAQDIGGSQYHNLVTQYSGTNGTVSNTVTYGGSWTDTSSYPHAGTTGDPLQDGDIQAEVSKAVAANGWTEDLNHIVAVFTATGIQECMGGTCTFTGGGNGFCAYHGHFSDSGNDAIYAYMAFDNFTHLAGYTCVAGQTINDNDPNRGVYPNGDVSADAEINTFSHELTESETDPHPNATWTGPNGEIGDACNFNFAPRNDNGADVFLNGDPYIVQQEYSNAAHTCAVDLPTNGFCSTAVSNVCAPTTAFQNSVDVANPRVDSTIHYTLSLNNTSDTGAETNLSVTDTLPVSYTVTALSAPNATSSSFTSSSVTVGYDTLPVHQSRSIEITVTVPEQAGVTATNCAHLDGQDLIQTGLADQPACVSVTPVKIPTVVQYDGVTTGDFNDPATLTATLTDDSLNPLANKQIDFSLNGTETCSAMTNGAGVASCPVTPGEQAGAYTVTASFDGTSDPVYASSTTSATFTVTLEETTTTYTGPTVILQGGSGVTLSGKLLEDGTTPIAGRFLTLSIGAQSCLAGPTAADGTASCSVTVTGALGSEPLVASFGGDPWYQASSDTSQTATVFAFPSRGAFTLGDNTVGAAGPSTTVTWWADVWSPLNSLSGGAAPNAFKGFASDVTLPTSTPSSVCGGNWVTEPGNSSVPPATVPTYMGVVVTDKVVKMGKLIDGTGTHIVVVKVNPGYAPDPFNHGTGTIVAQFC